MKPDQEKVRSLLTDTILLLCKNGLLYNRELKVEGLLGITLDDKDVFIVHINERVADFHNDSMDGVDDISIISDECSSSRNLQQSNGIHDPVLTGDTDFSQIKVSPSSELHRMERARESKNKNTTPVSPVNCASLELVKTEYGKDATGTIDVQTDSLPGEEHNDVNFSLKEETVGSTESMQNQTLSATDSFNDLNVPSRSERAAGASNIGLNLSIKVDQRKGSENFHRNNKARLGDACRKNNKSELDVADPNAVAGPVDAPARNEESLQEWFYRFLPSQIDELDGVSTSNNNNYLKTNQSSDCVSPNLIPQNISNVPLVTDLSRPRSCRKTNSLRTHHDLPLEPSSSLVDGSRIRGIHWPQQKQSTSGLQFSYEEVFDETAGVHGLNSSGPVRRPRSARTKPFVCQVPGCHRMFFRGSELYRHQREKHGARHVRPRGAPVAFV